MRTLLILSGLLLFTACGHQKKSPGSTTDARDAGTTDADAPLPSSFYKRFTGTVAGKPVIVGISGYNGGLQGAYYYTAIGQDIMLGAWHDTVKNDGVFLLNEIPAAGSAEGESAEATWSLRIAGNKASGTWRSANGLKEAPIELTESYEGAVALDAYFLSDSAALLPGKAGSPVATVTYSYLLPRGSGRGSFIYNVIKEQIAPQAPREAEVEEAVKSAMAAYFADYRKEVTPMAGESGADLECLAFSYTEDNAIYVRYNSDDWLVTELMSSSYTGGAHGNYGSSFANIDAAGKRLWKLTDMVADTAALRPLLNDAAISYFGLKPGEGMEERLLVDEVPPTENVYVGPKGLSFVYNPYEIASYADGQITLYIPYKKLQPLLTPAFRQRMKTGAGGGIAAGRSFHHTRDYASRTNA